MNKIINDNLFWKQNVNRLNQSIRNFCRFQFLEIDKCYCLNICRTICNRPTTSTNTLCLSSSVVWPIKEHRDFSCRAKAEMTFTSENVQIFLWDLKYAVICHRIPADLIISCARFTQQRMYVVMQSSSQNCLN